MNKQELKLILENQMAIMKVLNTHLISSNRGDETSRKRDDWELLLSRIDKTSEALSALS